MWLVDAIVCPLLIYHIGGGLFGALLYAIFYPFALAAAWPLPDSVSMFFVLATITPLLVWRNVRGAALSGFALGLSLWFRGDFLIFVPLLVVALWDKKQIAAFVSVWLVPTLLLGLFWLSTYGTFSLTRPGAGLLLWEGLGQQPNAWNIQPTDIDAQALLDRNGYVYGTSAADSFLFREWLRHVAEQPLWFIGSVFVRFTRVIGDNYGALFMLPAALGFWQARKDKRLLTICGAVWLGRIGPFSIMRDEPRFMLPVILVYFIGIGMLAMHMKPLTFTKVCRGN